MESNKATFLPEYPQKGLFFCRPHVEESHDASSLAFNDIRAFDCYLFLAESFLTPAHRLLPLMAFYCTKI